MAVSTESLPNLEALLGKIKNNNVSFGTTADRPLFPADLPPDRLGAEFDGVSAPNRAPGTYDNAEKTTSLYNIERQVTSLKGYTMGARTGPRFVKEFQTVTPCPTKYQDDAHSPKTSTPAKKPFHVGAKKFYKQTTDSEITPGPGTYKFDVERNRKVGYHGTFGGTQHLKVPPDESILLPEDCKGTTQKSRLMTYKEKRKFAIREAYLSLYY